jgi:hypothetical protein
LRPAASRKLIAVHHARASHATPHRGGGTATPSRIAESHDKVKRRLDELYRGAPEDFTAGRNELAAELKAAGEAEDAADVKRQQRPTQAASVVNRLSLEQCAA